MFIGSLNGFLNFTINYKSVVIGHITLVSSNAVGF